jgi:hypothetical protein
MCVFQFSLPRMCMLDMLVCFGMPIFSSLFAIVVIARYDEMCCGSFHKVPCHVSDFGCLSSTNNVWGVGGVIFIGSNFFSNFCKLIFPCHHHFDNLSGQERRRRSWNENVNENFFVSLKQLEKIFFLNSLFYSFR